MSMSYKDNIIRSRNNYIENNIKMILQLKPNNVIHLSIYKVDEIIMNFIKYVNDWFM